MNDDKSYVIATDVGGTCTDNVVFAASEPVHIGKAFSTPPNFANGVIDSIRSAAQAMDIRLGDLLRRSGLFTHGSTVVDNALLARDGARTGLITTEGFEDMGGTTFKVGVIQGGALEFAREPLVDRYHYVAPKIEVVSIGAGGGSIVSIEPRTNVPRVGPKSAGARPGPVCYGLGGAEPTLTDVMTLIGYMDPTTFLGGTMRLDVDAARAAFEAKIARPIGMDLNEAAFGICRVAAAQIADLIHEITVERGLDPRDFVLHAFGGSCPLLVAVFGQEFNVKRIVVPYTAAVNCVFGLVSADVVHEFAHTTTRPVPTPAEEINAIYAPMVERARAQLADEGFGDGDIGLEWSADLRHRLFRIVDEAVITLKHVSRSAITNEGHDLTVSLYRADGSLLMGGVGFLHHLTSAAEACKATIRRFGEDVLYLRWNASPIPCSRTAAPAPFRAGRRSMSTASSSTTASPPSTRPPPRPGARRSLPRGYRPRPRNEPASLDHAGDRGRRDPLPEVRPCARTRRSAVEAARRDDRNPDARRGRGAL